MDMMPEITKIYTKYALDFIEKSFESAFVEGDVQGIVSFAVKTYGLTESLLKTCVDEQIRTVIASLATAMASILNIMEDRGFNLTQYLNEEVAVPNDR